MKRIAILGSTGSIGEQTLDVVARHPDRFEVVALAAGRRVDRLVEQARQFRPRLVSVSDPAQAAEVRAALGSSVEVVSGDAGLLAVATAPGDLVVAALVGAVGLEPVLAAIRAGRAIGLANKEVMVMAGALVRREAAARGVAIIPIDSEHSAIFQCLSGSRPDQIGRLILTCSGGPFRTWSAEAMANAKIEEALAHPKWSMGAKISIDSATLMNKGLEVIEARWLFDVPATRVDVVVHPQSIVHSLVEFRDRSVLAQLGLPDMRVPIAVALAHPERVDLELPRLDLVEVARLDFEAPDRRRFPCLDLAYRAVAGSEAAPAVLNAANEVAVEAFLAGRIAFPDIAALNARVLDAHLADHAGEGVSELAAVRAADAWARAAAHEWLAQRDAVPRAADPAAALAAAALPRAAAGALMPVLDTLVAVVPMLGILIFVHELGHFLVAKACGVRVLKFSIGFGAPIGIGPLRARWERGGTEYVIGWIPLGGFVRMLGEAMPGDDPTAEPPPLDARPDESLESKTVWQKLAVVFAGPAMNLLLPIVCLLGILWVGFPRPAAIVGTVEAGSPAATAGLRVGDRIVAVDGEPVAWWDEVVLPLRDRRAGAIASIEVERAGARETIPVPVATQKTRDRFGAVVDTGWIGISNRRQAALVGVPDAASEAARAGLRSGDLVVAVGETAVEDWMALEAAQAAAVAEAKASGLPRIVWTVERAKPGDPAATSSSPTATPRATATAPATKSGEGPASGSGDEPVAPATEKQKIALPLDADLARLGLIPATILVGYVSPGKPAAEAGLRANDLVLFVDGDPIGSFESFVSRVQTSGGRPLEITFSREGRVDRVALAAREETVPGLYEIEGLEEKVYQIGLGAAVSTLPGAIEKQQLRNPAESVPRAVEMAWAMTTDYLEGLGKLFTGEVGTDKLAGPIGIARIARKSLDQGWLDYLSMMMVISINLGFLNLLPIPILDGGQAVLYSIEGIKRAPLSIRTKEIATSVGFAVIVLLMGRAFWNDLTPFWLRFVSWLSSS